MAAAFHEGHLSLEQAVNRPAPAVADMVAAYLPGIKAEVSEPRVTPLPHGFRHQGVDLNLHGTAWPLLRVFLENAEAQRPPWRVTSLDLRAGLDQLEGALRLESLDKAAPVP